METDMRGRIQFIILLLVIVVAASFLVAWTWGLLDMGTEDEGEVLLEHGWRATGTEAEPELHEVNLSFQVGPKVGRIRLDYEVDLPSDLTVGIPGSTETPSPEVRLALLDGSGSPVWSEDFHASAGATVDVNVTTSGTWTLQVWARGYGYEGQTVFGTTVEFHDSVAITVRGL